MLSTARRLIRRRLVLLLSLAALTVVAASAWRVSPVDAQSCDGNLIAYVTSDTSRVDLFLIRPDGTGERRIRGFEDSYIDYFVGASPDGGFIIFQSVRRFDEFNTMTSLFRINPDGSGLTNLSNAPGESHQYPTLSADGTKIAYENAGSLFVMNADGSDKTNLANSTDTDYRSPGFSLDGSKIVFTGSYAGVFPENIFTINTDGTAFTQLTDSYSGDDPAHTQPRYSPDGTLIYFLSDEGNGAGYNYLYAMSSLGSPGFAQLTNEGNVASYDFSPDGSKIAYGGPSVGTDPDGDIVVMNANGSNKVNITNRPGRDRGPKFSRDGARIAFGSDRDPISTALGLYVMNADGTGVSPRLSPAAQESLPRDFFVPDTDRDGVPDPCDNCLTSPNPDQADNDLDGIGNACDIDDDNDGVLDETDNCSLVPNPDQLNTDGDAQGNACDADDDNDGIFDGDDNCPLVANPEKILFVSNNEIYTVNADGTNVQQLTNSSGNNTLPEYSPAANKIVFTSTRDGNNEIYTMNPDGSNVTRITNNPRSDRNPTFSPDGTKIIFDSDRDAASPDGFHLEVYVMNADGTNQTRLTTTPVNSFNRAVSAEPSFSPDGTRIVFSSDRDSGSGIGYQNDIYLMNPDGSGVVRLTETPRGDVNPAYSPDGSKIAFTSDRDGSNLREIYAMNANGTNPIRLTNNGTNIVDSNPAFSPDGSMIAFISTRDGAANHIFVMNSDGSNQTRLLNHPSTEFTPSYVPQLDSDGDGIGDACDPAFDADTQTGSDVTVQTGDAAVTFANVSQAGTTSFTTIVASQGDMPAGYTLCPTCPAYDITTTAVYTPPVTVCLAVPTAVDQQAYLLLKLMHLEDGTYVDHTTGHFTDAGGLRFVCGVVDSLSPFALASSQSPTAAPGGISGQIAQADGAPLAGVVIRLGGAQSRKTISDANGFYRFDNVDTGDFYTVTPARLNYHFDPGNRSFSLLANVTDAVFAATPDAVIVGNVIDTPEYFVRQHYLDFLGREPDESGFNFWSDQLLECGADVDCLERRRVNVSAAYFLSIEFQETGGLVDGLYRASYGRRPQYAEFMPDSAIVGRDVVVGRSGWAQQLEANKQAFIDAWVQRPAFQSAYGDLTNASYVDTLISHTGVSFSQAERDALVGGLNGGTSTRANVLRQIAENERFVNAKRNQTFVLMQYFGYLRRDPDESGYAFWLAKLNQFNGNFEQAEMVKAFLVSGEYRQRFVIQEAGGRSRRQQAAGAGGLVAATLSLQIGISQFAEFDCSILRPEAILNQ